MFENFAETVSFDDRYGIHMNAFFNLVNSASITYDELQEENTFDEIQEKIASDKLDLKSFRQVIHFNSSNSPKEYGEILNKNYNRATNEFGISLTEIINKQDRLILVTSIVVEVKSFKGFLKKTKSRDYSHALFDSSNLSPKIKNYKEFIDESSYQDYYYWMNFYLKKISDYLENQKKDIRSMSQDDLIKYPSSIQNNNVSSKEKPFVYFEYLFTRNGLDHLLYDFITPHANVQYNSINYDPITGILKESYVDTVTGDLINFDSTFQDYYLKYLVKEYNNSIKLIDQYIDDQEQESFVLFYLKKNYNKLNSLLKIINSNNAINKHEDSPKPIKGLIRHIEEKTKNYNESPGLDLVKISSEKNIKKYTSKVSKTSFGYKALETIKLQNVLQSLTLNIDLITDSILAKEELLELLCSKNFLSKNYRINITCETTQFAYIIKELKPYFKDLNPKMIETSNCFYSKKGILIKAQNMYSNNVDNTKGKQSIDNIIKQLQ